MRTNTSSIERFVVIIAALMVVLAIAAFINEEAVPSEQVVAGTTAIAQTSGREALAVKPEAPVKNEISPGSIVEDRTYEIKMISRQLIRNTRWQIGILLVIAALLALALWMLGRQRTVLHSDLSAEIANTLVAVEERQAKLTNILKEIQQEIDYVHSMSVPDLKKLIEQAERYIEQNEKDLGRTAAARKGAEKGGAATANRSAKPS